MTELEKKAFEYRKELVPYTELGYPDVEIPVYEALDIDRAYVAGAKENGVVWHDLRKNPNDLPKEFDRIKKAFGIYPEEKTIHIVLNQDGEYVHCLSGNWYYFYDEDVVGDSRKADVIAWCETPKFEVEK